MPMPIRERYETDAAFRMLVDVMESYIDRAQFTPSEMREAVIIAAIRYEMRRPFSMRIAAAETALEALGFDRKPTSATPPTTSPTVSSCCADGHAAQAKCGEVFTSTTSLAFSMAARSQHESECAKCQTRAAPPTTKETT